MIVLGIETSCDETSAAVVEDGNRVRSNVIFSQWEHSRYGGIVPELASRAHLRKIIPVLDGALEEGRTSLSDLGGIAVTQGPGLVGSLLVGISVAKAMAMAEGLPLVGVHHLEGHIFANVLEHPEVSPPFLVLLASGGHTELIHVRQFGQYQIVGRTRDDAAGEAFDKVAKILGLFREVGPAMGGPIIDRLARDGDPAYVRFPRGLMDGRSLDFSFSGLKTAVINYLRKSPESEIQARLPDITASFQAAVVDVLVQKSVMAATQRDLKQIVLVGGVAANAALRAALVRCADEHGLSVCFPSPVLCTDNAAMIAAAGIFRLSHGERSDWSLSADPRLALVD